MHRSPRWGHRAKVAGQLALPLACTLVTLFLVKAAAAPRLGSAAAALLERMGPLAPALFVALLAVRPLVLLPGQAFAALAGVLWGTVEGSLLALAGTALAMVLVTALGSRLLERPIGRLAGERRHALSRMAARHDLAYAFLVTLNPLLPSDVCLALGAGAGGRRSRLIAGAVAGSIPGTLATAAFGSALSRDEPVALALSLTGMVVSLAGGALLGRAVWREVRRPEVVAPASGAPPPRLAAAPRDR